MLHALDTPHGIECIVVVVVSTDILKSKKHKHNEVEKKV